MEPIGGLLILLWILSKGNQGQAPSGFVGPLPSAALPPSSPILGFQPGPTGTLVGTPVGTGGGTFTDASPVPAPSPISVIGMPQAAPPAPLPTLIPVTPAGSLPPPNPVAPSPRPGTSYSVDPRQGPSQSVLPSPLDPMDDDGRPPFCAREWRPVLDTPCPEGMFEPPIRRGPPPPGTFVLTGPVPGSTRRLASGGCPDPQVQGGLYYMVAGDEAWNALCGTGPQAITGPLDA